jgi:Spy/CpxP family protein refolding chaperone
MMLRRLTAGLNLTDAQKEQARSIFTAARQSSEPVRAQLRQSKQALAAAVKAGASSAQIDQLSNSMGPLLAQAAAIHAKAFSQFYSILTPDQKSTLDNRMQNRSRGHRAAQPVGE